MIRCRLRIRYAINSMSSPTPPSNKTGNELSNEVRMVLAFVLMGLILVATPFVYKKLGIAPPDEQKKTEAPAPAKPSGGGGTDKPLSSANPAVATPAMAANVISAAAPESITVETPIHKVIFSNQGAVVTSWTLKQHKDSARKPLELINTAGVKKMGLYPFSLDFRGNKPSRDLNKVLWNCQKSGGGFTVTCEFSDGRTAARKTFAFQHDGPLMEVSDEVTQDGRGVNNLFQWRGGFGDMAVHEAPSLQATIHYDTQEKKLIRTAAKSAKDGPQIADGVFSFAGLDDQYFCAVFLPKATNTVQTTTFDDIVPTSFATSEEPYPGVAAGGEAHNQLAVYVGPKEISTLHTVNPKLEDIVDWGWFGFIAKPLFLVLHWLNNQYIHNYGWSIILLTLAINIALFPLKLANLKSMRKMQVLQPEINKINEKYKGVGMSDPKAQLKQQEIMDLHKKHGVNPLGGCIPLLIQMPFLWAFYKVLTVSIELRFAEWFWVTDLSQPEHFAIRVLPLILVITGFLLQKMTPMPAGGDPAQQKMMQFMPLMWGFFFWSAQSGLVLYWLTGNLVGILQQWFFNATSTPAKVPAGVKTITAKDGKKKF